MKILTSKNYNLFSRSPYNREVQKIGKLISSMKDYGWLDGYPIRVNKRNDGKLVIEDGQHRFESARELGIPVKYVIAEDGIDISIPKVNNAQRVWNLTDYVSSYAQQGKSDYVKLVRFSTANKIPLGISATILTNGTHMKVSGDVSALVKSGDFKITSELYANRIAEIVQMCAQRNPFSKNRNFIAAIAKALLVVDAAELKKRLLANSHRMSKRSSIDEYLAEVEMAYNYGNHKKLPIKFMASQAVSLKSPIKKSV